MNKQKNCSGISTRLKLLRVEAGYTQADIALKLGISQQMYSKLENTDTPLDSDRLLKLCELYGVSADYILGLTIPPQKQEVKQTAFEESQIDDIVEKVLSRINKANGG